MTMRPSVKKQMIEQLNIKKQQREQQHIEFKQKRLENIIFRPYHFDSEQIENSNKEKQQICNDNNNDSQRNLQSARGIPLIKQNILNYRIDDKKNRVGSSVQKVNKQKIQQNRELLKQIKKQNNQNNLLQQNNFKEDFKINPSNLTNLDYSENQNYRALKQIQTPTNFQQQSNLSNGFKLVDSLESRNYNAIQDNLQIQIQLMKLQSYNQHHF